MIPKNYWSPQEWPYEAEGMIFGCPAVHRVGHHLFPGEWRENDPRSPSPSFPSDHSQPEIWPENVTTANRQQRFEAASYLTTTYPELASRYPLLGRSGVRPQILPDIHLTSEQWQMAHRKRAEMAALQAEVRDRLRKGYRRFSEVKEIIRKACAWGHLASFAQLDSGDFFPIPKNLWNTPRFEGWFKYGGRIAARDIVSSGWISSKGQTYPLFFSESQLDKLLSSLQPKVSHSKGMKTWVEEQYAFVDGLGKQITFDDLVKVTRKQFLKARKEDVQQIVTGVRPKHWSSTGRIPADKKLSLDEFLRLRGNGPKTLK